MFILIIFSLISSFSACPVFSPFDGCKDFRPTGSRLNIPRESQLIAYYDLKDLPSSEHVEDVIELIKKKEEKTKRTSLVKSKQLEDQYRKENAFNNRIRNYRHFEYFGIDLERMGIERLPENPFQFNKKELRHYLKNLKHADVFQELKEKEGINLKEIIKNMEQDIPRLYRLLDCNYPGDVDLYQYMFFKKAQIANNSELINRITSYMQKLNSLRRYKGNYVSLEGEEAHTRRLMKRRDAFVRNVANAITAPLRDRALR